MTVNELIAKTSITPLALCAPDREIRGGYAGDLLSWVMGNARADSAWVTIMTNQNIVAVAGLVDLACVVVAEGAEVPREIIEIAREKGVNLLTSDAASFELCALISSLI